MLLIMQCALCLYTPLLRVKNVLRLLVVLVLCYLDEGASAQLLLFPGGVLYLTSHF